MYLWGLKPGSERFGTALAGRLRETLTPKNGQNSFWRSNCISARLKQALGSKAGLHGASLGPPGSRRGSPRQPRCWPGARCAGATLTRPGWLHSSCATLKSSNRSVSEPRASASGSYPALCQLAPILTVAARIERLPDMQFERQKPFFPFFGGQGLA